MRDHTKRWFTRAEAAAYMGVDVTTIDRWVREYGLTRFKVADSRSTRLDAHQLDALVSPEQTEAPGASTPGASGSTDTATVAQ